MLNILKRKVLIKSRKKGKIETGKKLFLNMKMKAVVYEKYGSPDVLKFRERVRIHLLERSF
jgi:hypothetical protein